MKDDQQAVADNLIADAIDAAEDIRDPLDSRPLHYAGPSTADD